GVGRLPDGRAVFVPRTAPGDRVRVRDVKLRKHFAHATLHEIVTPSGARVSAPCGHYQHDHCGGCQLQHLSYDAQLAAKRAIVGDALRRIGKIDVADPDIVEAVDEWRYAERLRTALAEGEQVVCWWQPAEGAARVVAGPEMGYPATAFEQVNPEMGTLARRWAVEQLGDLRGCTVWDLYGGIGDTAWLLAGRAAQVVSVDVDEKAIAWARRRGVGDGHAVRFIAAKAEDVLPSLPEPHAVVCNPPSGGLPWDVTLRLTGQP